MTESNLTAAINQDEKLDISIERVEKLNSPLLVIGLGGTGTDILRTIKNTLAERYILPKDRNGNLIPVPEKTAYIGIDTDHKSSEGFDKNNEFIDITLQGLEAILDPANRDNNLTPYERKWVNRNLNSAVSGIGAGTYRQAARFMLYRKYREVIDSLTRTLQRIASVEAGTSSTNNRTEIVITTGICGGTGSGTFLDIAQIVRYIMKTDSRLRNQQYHLTGYIIMPDISISKVQGKTDLTGVLERNSFAALKELDFWMSVGEHKTPYTAQFDEKIQIPWNRAPFDACILMSGTTVDGTIYSDADKVARKTIAENLLHYLANEIPSKNADGRQEFTFIQYEDNLKAVVGEMMESMPQKLPLYYGYRAIGAYTKRIPKKKLLYYEGSLIFSHFIPQRDENQRLVPNDTLFHDGHTVDRANTIVNNPQTLYINFSQHLPLPSFCSASPNERDKMDLLRNMRPMPHDRADTQPQLWRTSSVRPGAMKSANTYLDAAWEKFVEFATSVITDPKLGPFSLKAYLESANGLVQALETKNSEWAALADNFAKDETIKYQDCRGNKWNDFVHPPMLSAKKAIVSYLKALGDYYNSVRRSTFMAEHAKAIAKFTLRVKEFVGDALTPLCNDILRLEATFNSTESTTSSLESDLFSLDVIMESVNQELEEKNVDNRVVSEFLNNLCLTSLVTRPTVDAHTSGVSFVYHENGMSDLLEMLRSSLNKCFEVLNGQSLDSIMVRAVGNDLARQQEYMDKLARSVLTSAKPMFAQDPTHAAEKMAPYSYLSVPDDSPLHIERYNNTLINNNVEPKGSSIHDHIYCISAWDGLPLYRYGQIQAIEAMYNSSLTNPKSSMGIHLVWDGNLESDYTSNWTKLPSPRPYFLFSTKGPDQAVAMFISAREIVNRAMKCGLMEVDSSSRTPILRFHFYYVNNQMVLIKSSEGIIKEVDGILNAKDPTTGDKYASSKLYDLITEYRNAADGETVPCPYTPGCMATTLSLEKAPCDPWDDSIASNPTTLATSVENHKQLCIALAAAIIYSQPKLYAQLKEQLEGFEYIQKQLNDLINIKIVWEPRIAYADQFALLFIHQIIRPSFNDMEYIDASNQHVPVIQPQLLKDDLKGETQIVRCAAYLGDLVKGNQTKFELETLLKEHLESLAEKEHNHLIKREDIEEIMKTISIFLSICEKEYNEHKAKLRKQDTDAYVIGKILNCLDAITAKAKNEQSRLQNILISWRD